MTSIEQHQEEINLNQQRWDQKPLLQRVYRQFYQDIASQISGVGDLCVEIGSGIGNIKEVIPNCRRTDIFDHPWLDAVENAYDLSFSSGSVSDVILFDVFHHLRYPGEALVEFQRVLMPRGRLLIFEPCVSALGRVVYGPMHPEPLGLNLPITWQAPERWDPRSMDYYAAQGNAWRLFVKKNPLPELDGWSVHAIRRSSAFSYVTSGGYSGPQLYPQMAYPIMRAVDRLLDVLPALFATRLLVVLQKL
ncbi:MAG: class I SAM-dependent methyltransferase [bacterium]